MDPFCYDELSQDERLYLSSFAKHPGFLVLKKMMENASRQATEAVIKLNPDDKDFDTKLKNRQMTARIVNDLCATLIKSIVMHSNAAAIQEEQEEFDKKMKEAGVAIPEELGLGSVRIKPLGRK